MSRCGYDNDCDSQEALWAAIRWAGAVNSAVKGRRGQALLRCLRDTLDAMPEKVLCADSLESDGQFCTLGVECHARGIDVRDLHPQDHRAIASVLDAAPALVREIAFQNDEWGDFFETPEQRWARMRRWVDEKIQEPTGRMP